MTRQFLALMCLMMYHNGAYSETFVKPNHKQQRVSCASLQEEGGSLMADMLEASQVCLQQLFGSCSEVIIEIQQTLTKAIRTLVYNDASACHMSKAELSARNEKLMILKKRFHKTGSELNRIGEELRSIKKELKELEATS